jgi:SAM-dependent methyltransferase
VRAAEWMDDAGVSAEELHRSLRFIRRVNRWLGYTRSIVAYFDRFSRGWKRGERITILDLATGSADVPMAILRWASERGWDVRIVGVDRHPETARVAAGWQRDERLTVVQADVLSLPFEAGSFDYVMCSMFLHHLDDAQPRDVVHTMDRLARRGIVVSDLLRHRRAYAWIWLFTAFSSPMVRHDGRASVRQAFSEAEVKRWTEGLDYLEYRRHFGHRFVLAGEKHVPHRNLSVEPDAGHAG